MVVEATISATDQAGSSSPQGMEVDNNGDLINKAAPSRVDSPKPAAMSDSLLSVKDAESDQEANLQGELEPGEIPRYLFLL